MKRLGLLLMVAVGSVGTMVRASAPDGGISVADGGNADWSSAVSLTLQVLDTGASSREALLLVGKTLETLADDEKLPGFQTLLQDIAETGAQRQKDELKRRLLEEEWPSDRCRDALLSAVDAMGTNQALATAHEASVITAAEFVRNSAGDDKTEQNIANAMAKYIEAVGMEIGRAFRSLMHILELPYTVQAHGPPRLLPVRESLPDIGIMFESGTHGFTAICNDPLVLPVVRCMHVGKDACRQHQTEKFLHKKSVAVFHYARRQMSGMSNSPSDETLLLRI